MVVAVKDLTRGEYELFRKLVYAKSGISLGDQKMELVRARLGKRLRQEGFRSFREYYNHIVNDPTGEELCGLLDAISTNTTHLFRESRHFELLNHITVQWTADRANPHISLAGVSFSVKGGGSESVAWGGVFVRLGAQDPLSPTRRFRLVP